MDRLVTRINVHLHDGDGFAIMRPTIDALRSVLEELNEERREANTRKAMGSIFKLSPEFAVYTAWRETLSDRDADWADNIVLKGEHYEL